MANKGSLSLTEERIARLIRDNQNRDARDRSESGLVLRVKATSGSEASASWSFQFRRKDGSSQRLTLGTYTNAASRRSTREALTLQMARDAAKVVRGSIVGGADPIQARADAQRLDDEKKAERAADITVTAMLEMWMAQNAGLRTIASDRSMFRTDIIAPKGDNAPLGNKTLSKVGKRDIARVIDRAINRGSPVTATRLLRRLSTAFKWAVSRDYVPSNPCVGISQPVKYSDRARERVLDTQELRAFLVTLPATGLIVAHQRILMLELLTGQRLGEICGMRKMEINLVDCLWSIPGIRTKNQRDHVCPLPPRARSIILAAMEDAGSSEYVFPNRLGEPIDGNIAGHALVRVQHAPAPVKKANPKSKHARKNAPVHEYFGFTHPQTGEPNPFTSHDLRRTLATQVEKLGVPLRVISKLLNHTEAKSVTDAVYAHADLMAERYEALVRWERALSDITNGLDPFSFSASSFRDIEARILGPTTMQIEAS
jgi:integrase